MAITAPPDVVRHVGDDDAPWADTGAGVDLKVVRLRPDPGHLGHPQPLPARRPAPDPPPHRAGRRVHPGRAAGTTSSTTSTRPPGSYIFEPANSVHTLDVPEDNAEDTDVLFVIEGALLHLDPDGKVESTTDGPGILEVYYALLEAQGDPRPNGLIV